MPFFSSAIYLRLGRINLCAWSTAKIGCNTCPVPCGDASKRFPSSALGAPHYLNLSSPVLQLAQGFLDPLR